MNSASARIYIHVVRLELGDDDSCFEVLNYSIRARPEFNGCSDDFQLAVTNMAYVFEGVPNVVRNLKVDQHVRFFMDVEIYYSKDWLGEIDACYYHSNVKVVDRSIPKRVPRSIRKHWYRTKSK